MCPTALGCGGDDLRQHQIRNPGFDCFLLGWGLLKERKSSKNHTPPVLLSAAWRFLDLGNVSAQQAVGVLVETPFPRSIGMGSGRSPPRPWRGSRGGRTLCHCRRSSSRPGACGAAERHLPRPEPPWRRPGRFVSTSQSPMRERSATMAGLWSTMN